MRAARTENEGIQHDIHERDLEFLAKVYENAMFVAKYLGWTMINCATKDGKRMRSIDAIHKDVYKAINEATATNKML